nr:hypothetical protein [Tanacetum cinerariifolium]
WRRLPEWGRRWWVARGGEWHRGSNRSSDKERFWGLPEKFSGGGGGWPAAGGEVAGGMEIVVVRMYLSMERGFLSSSGRGVKEKNGGSNNSDSGNVIGSGNQDSGNIMDGSNVSIYANFTVSPIDPKIFGPVLSRPTLYVKLVTSEPSRKSVNFCTLLASVGNAADVAILLEFIRVVSARYANTTYGFFFGK